MWLPVVVAALVVACSAVKHGDFSTAKATVKSTVTYVKTTHIAVTEGDEETTATDTKELTRKASVTSH